MLEPGRWEKALGRIRETVHCLNAALVIQALPSGRLLLTMTSGIDAAHLATLNDYGSDVVDQWGGLETIMSYSMDVPLVLSRERPRALWENNRYFAEWARPQGIFDVLGIVVARDSGAYGSLGFGRHISAGPVTESELTTLRLIMPHLQRAVGISRLMDIRTLAVSSFEATLNALSAGIVLVDVNLGIVHANEAAEAMLAAGEPIASVRNTLDVSFGPAQQALSAAVAQASRDESLIGRLGYGIPTRYANGDPAVLHVLPLRHGTLRPGLSPSAVAAVFIAPATLPRPAPEQALAALFDLTPSEAKVFSLVASGQSLAETAAAIGIAQSTAKTHLQHLFSKTGTSRQAELIKLAGSLAMLG